MRRPVEADRLALAPKVSRRTGRPEARHAETVAGTTTGYTVRMMPLAFVKPYVEPV